MSRRLPAGGALLGALCGAWAAGLLVQGYGRSQAAPPGWSLDTGGRPAVAISDAGDPPRAGSWRLEPLSTLEPMVAPRALAVELELDPADQVELLWGPLRTVLRAGERVVLEGAHCALPLVVAGPRTRVELAQGSEDLTVTVDDVVGRCPPVASGLILRAGASRVQLAGLAVNGQPLPPPVSTAVVGVSVGLGALLGAAAGALVGLRWILLLLPGLLLGAVLGRGDPAAHAVALRLPALASPWSPGAVCLGLGGLGLALGAAARRAKAGGPPTGSRGYAGLLLGLAWGPLAVLRMGQAPLLPTLGSALAAAVAGAAAWLFLVLAGRFLGAQSGADARRTAAAASGLGLATLVLALAWGLVPPAGLVAAGAVGAALGGILWANRNAARVRAFNLLSLALSLAALAGLEQAVALSQAAAGWRQAATWVERSDPSRTAEPQWSPSQSALADFDDLEAARHSAYPSRGYPVAFGPKQAPQRVVALGGSSTGGAYQMDDLRQFWPARLDALLGARVEVVNQGVGGWTTFHIARYLQRQEPALDPDLLVLYVGNNDSGGDYPATLAQLYATWQAQERDIGLPGWLRRRSLVQWGLQAGRARLQADGVAAVSLVELRDNLDSVQAVAGDARILVVGEANSGANPDLERYHRVMRAWARQAGAGWLDGQDILSTQPANFVDTVHLSEQGHRVLARAIADGIADQGLLEEQ